MGLCRRADTYYDEPLFSLDPLTSRGRLCQFVGLAVIPLIPCLGVIIYASVNLALAVSSYGLSSSVQQALLDGRHVTGVVSALYEEMGGATSSIVSNGSEIIDSSAKIYKRTDDQLASFRHWRDLATTGTTERRFLADIRAERRLLEFLNTTVHDVLAFYAGHADVLTDWVRANTDRKLPASVTSSYVEYHKSIGCMKHLAFVRSIGTVALLRGSMTDEERLTFGAALDVYAANLVDLDADADADADAHDAETLVDMHLPIEYANVFGLYGGVNRLPDTYRPDLYQSLVWYRRLSSVFDGLVRINLASLDSILAAVGDDVDNGAAVIAVYAAFLAVLVLLATPFIVVSARHSVISLHGYATVMETRLLEIKRERHKTDIVLNEMLPRVISYKLQKGERTPAEMYSSATVFFSDIEDFSEISARSSPIDIVVFLNDIYTHMDALMDQGYDTYKVETIGCVYMVVSGVPGRNGKRHASEIARMSLDLMKSTEQFVIHHLPHRPLHLRAGMHSGAVVAGVVGNKMPRYCLFGDTVNTASRMQSNGVARRIHISHTTKELLDEIGGYTTIERGLITIKGKGAMRTHWLISRNAKTTIKPREPDTDPSPNRETTK